MRVNGFSTAYMWPEVRPPEAPESSSVAPLPQAEVEAPQVPGPGAQGSAVDELPAVQVREEELVVGGRTRITPDAPTALQKDGKPGAHSEQEHEQRHGRGQKSDAQLPGHKELTADQEREVARLRARDAEVRAHEAAHAAAAGAHGGGASFSYEKGPDGRSYAVGGEVPVQLSTGNSPEETIRNAQQVRAAALAPAEPSGQDRAVAAAAAAMEAQARAEKAQESGGPEKQDPSKPEGAGDKPGRPEGDPSSTLSRLESERREIYGERGHPHKDDGCGPCGKAVAAYR